MTLSQAATLLVRDPMNRTIQEFEAEEVRTNGHPTFGLITGTLRDGRPLVICRDRGCPAQLDLGLHHTVDCAAHVAIAAHGATEK
jgi:hypothetical protein